MNSRIASVTGHAERSRGLSLPGLPLSCRAKSRHLSLAASFAPGAAKMKTTSEVVFARGTRQVGGARIGGTGGKMTSGKMTSEVVFGNGGAGHRPEACATRRTRQVGGARICGTGVPPVMRAGAIALLLAMFALLLGGQVAGEAEPPVRFTSVEVFIDTGEQPLAAWQFELAAERGSVKIVGIEGGDHPAFKSPPYYDPAAMQHDRVILAAFNTGKDLPKGKTRIARIHVQITGDVQPEYAIRLEAAGGPDGSRIQATLSLGKGEAK